MQGMNPAWDEAVIAIIKDVASMPSGTWAKYWRGSMMFLDWLCDPESQVCQFSELCMLADDLGMPKQCCIVHLLKHHVCAVQ